MYVFLSRVRNYVDINQNIKETFKTPNYSLYIYIYHAIVVRINSLTFIRLSAMILL